MSPADYIASGTALLVAVLALAWGLVGAVRALRLERAKRSVLLLAPTVRAQCPDCRTYFQVRLTGKDVR